MCRSILFLQLHRRCNLRKSAQVYSGKPVLLPGFTVRDGERFDFELSRCLTREITFEAVMRVRVTKGMRITNFYGNHFSVERISWRFPASVQTLHFADFVHEQPVLNTGTIR